MEIDETGADVDWVALTRMYAEVGWGERRAEDVRQAFERSWCKAFAFIEGQLVGFGRVVGDGVYYGSVVDLIVSPRHQRRGIGAAILAALQARANASLSLSLTAAPEVQSFYQRHGWRLQTTAMLLPRSRDQAVRNCVVVEDGVV